MTEYRAPLRDMKFVINELADVNGVFALPGFEELHTRPRRGGAGGGRQAGQRRAGAAEQARRPSRAHRWAQNGVVAAEGFADAYRAFVENGWCALSGDPEHGGQGLPGLVRRGDRGDVERAPNMAFALCPMLTAGAMEAIKAHASEELKAIYLPKLVSGEWTGTMNLTEPQAGSDLAAVRTRGGPGGRPLPHLRPEDLHHLGRSRHDAETSCIWCWPACRTRRTARGHLAVPGAEVSGQSRRQPRRAQRRALRARWSTSWASMRSPTCVMAFGEKDGAVGYLVGEENQASRTCSR